MQNNKTDDRITIHALEYYVPLFQAGEKAEEYLLNNINELGVHEINNLEAMIHLSDLAAKKIASLCGPLITREINKIISGSHLKNREDLFDMLYYAGIDGMKRGLRKFEIGKINSSSTNYLFQWIVTYAKKELIVMEAPFGIPPSRFQKYKKISAVRKRLSEQLERPASNEEILDYFISGKADIVTMNGKIGSKNKLSAANQNMTLEIISEQENFEKNMMNVEIIDTQDNNANNQLSTRENNTLLSFDETVFGTFISSHNLTDEAKAVIMSELGANYLTEDQINLLQNLPPSEYKYISTQWKNLVRDINGPFYKFLINNRDQNFTQFDINQTIRSIEGQQKKINSALYNVLFKSENGK